MTTSQYELLYPPSLKPPGKDRLPGIWTGPLSYQEYSKSFLVHPSEIMYLLNLNYLVISVLHKSHSKYNQTNTYSWQWIGCKFVHQEETRQGALSMQLLKRPSGMNRLATTYKLYKVASENFVTWNSLWLHFKSQLKTGENKLIKFVDNNIKFHNSRNEWHWCSYPGYC